LSTKDLKKDWEDMADLDPYWAILSDSKKKIVKWNIDEFFLTGQKEIEHVLKFTDKLGLSLKHYVALDFECEVGR